MNQKTDRRATDELLLTKHAGKKVAWIGTDDSGDLYYDGDEARWRRLVEKVYRQLEILEKKGIGAYLHWLDHTESEGSYMVNVTALEQLVPRLPAGTPGSHEARMEILDDIWGQCSGWGDEFSARMWVRASNASPSPEPNGSLENDFIEVPPWMRTPREAVAWSVGKNIEEYGED